jgi:hypothetical protein
MNRNVFGGKKRKRRKKKETERRNYKWTSINLNGVAILIVAHRRVATRKGIQWKVATSLRIIVSQKIKKNSFKSNSMLWKNKKKF